MSLLQGFKRLKAHILRQAAPEVVAAEATLEHADALEGFESRMEELRRAGIQPRLDEPEAVRLRAAIETEQAVETVQRAWQGADPRPATLRSCRCEASNLDRMCLGCGRRLCAGCQPRTGGAPCTLCGGPVWQEGEERAPARSNPRMKGF